MLEFVGTSSYVMYFISFYFLSSERIVRKVSHTEGMFTRNQISVRHRNSDQYCFLDLLENRILVQMVLRPIQAYKWTK